MNGSAVLIKLTGNICYSVAPTDDLIRFWRSKVKVTTGCWVKFC